MIHLHPYRDSSALIKRRQSLLPSLGIFNDCHRRRQQLIATSFADKLLNDLIYSTRGRDPNVAASLRRTTTPFLKRAAELQLSFMSIFKEDTTHFEHRPRGYHYQKNVPMAR